MEFEVNIRQYLLKRRSTYPNNNFTTVKMNGIKKTFKLQHPQKSLHPSFTLPSELNDDPDVLILRKKDFAAPEILDSRQTANRMNLLGWWVKTSNEYMDLKWKTIDLAIRLFDYYTSKKYEKSQSQGGKRGLVKPFHILDCKMESKLTVTACFFSAAKYNEIYPPSLNDFLFFEEKNLKKQQIIQRECDIVVTTKCNYNISLITDWFDVMCADEKIPPWGIECYLFAPSVSSENLGLAIYQVWNASKGASQVLCQVFVLKLLGIKPPASLQKKLLSDHKKVDNSFKE